MTEWSSMSFCNRWLRSQAKLPSKLRSTLIYCTLQEQELLSVLETIRQFEEAMTYGEVPIAVTRKQDKCAGTIEISVVDSKEMSS